MFFVFKSTYNKLKNDYNILLSRNAQLTISNDSLRESNQKYKETIESYKKILSNTNPLFITPPKDVEKVYVTVKNTRKTKAANNTPSTETSYGSGGSTSGDTIIMPVPIILGNDTPVSRPVETETRTYEKSAVKVEPVQKEEFVTGDGFGNDRFETGSRMEDRSPSYNSYSSYSDKSSEKSSSDSYSSSYSSSSSDSSSSSSSSDSGSSSSSSDSSF